MRAYLRRRGLTVETSELRYHPRTPCGSGSAARFLPALLAVVRDDEGVLGIHRTFLDPIAGCLADLAEPKRALGRLGCGAVRLRRPLRGVLGLAEGIESALSAIQLTGIPCWATLGTERFARVTLPAGVDRLVLFLDNDSGGRRAEALARSVLHDRPITIEACRPRREGADWNDELLETLGARS